MKCTMRCLHVSRAAAPEIAGIVVQKLCDVLAETCKNPQNPQFNHYLFESLAVMISSLCGPDPSHVATFEGLLFPPFNLILQNSVEEVRVL